MKVRAIYKPDGSVSVIHPAPNSRKFSIQKTKLDAFETASEDPNTQDVFVTVEMPLCLKILRENKCGLALEHEKQYPGSFDFEPEDQWLSRVFEKATPEELPYEDIDDSTLPNSREDREAWEHNPSGGVRVNAAKALQIKEAKSKAVLIASEEKRIVNEQAIANLTAQGKI